MKLRSLICFIYNLGIVIYFIQSYNTTGWFGFRIGIDLLCFAAYIIVSKSRQKSTSIDDLLLNYTIGALIVRSVYTEICVFQPKGWIYEHTLWFTILYAITFSILAIYCIYLYIKI